MTNISPTGAPRNRPLYAELTDCTCTSTGLTARGAAPVLALCRQLLAAGADPDASLEVFRRGTLALRVRSLREAAQLEIGGDGTSFRRRRQPDAASPIAPN